MAEPNYTLKITLTEANIIRASLIDSLERTEERIQNYLSAGDEPTPEMVKMLDGVRRLIQRM